MGRSCSTRFTTTETRLARRAHVARASLPYSATDQSPSGTDWSPSRSRSRNGFRGPVTSRSRRRDSGGESRDRDGSSSPHMADAYVGRIGLAAPRVPAGASRSAHHARGPDTDDRHRSTSETRPDRGLSIRGEFVDRAQRHHPPPRDDVVTSSLRVRVTNCSSDRTRSRPSAGKRRFS